MKKLKPGTIVVIACIVIIVGAIAGYFIYTTYAGDDDDDNDKPPVTKINHRPNAKFVYIYLGMFPVEGDTIYFNASGSSDADNDALLYYWDFDGSKDLDGDGKFNNDKEAEGLNVSKAFNRNGTYLVTLTVNDTKLEDTDKKIITVEVLQDYVPPEAVLTCAGKKEGLTGNVRYLISVASVDPLYYSVNYTAEIYNVINDTWELYYSAPLSNLTGQLSYIDVDNNQMLSQGDTFSLIPDDAITAKDGDIFTVRYMEEDGPCGAVALTSFGL